MEFDDELDDGEAPAALLPPEDRLWRHPSELGMAEEPLPSPSPRHQRFEPRFWTIVVVAGAIGALLGTTATFAARGHRTRTITFPALERRAEPFQVERATNSVTPPGAPAPVDAMDVFAITRRVRPSIVRLETRGPGAVVDGSGVLFRSDGYLLTSSAVVVGTTSIVAVLADGRRLRVRTIGSDPETGVAVGKIDGYDFDVATLGSSKSLQVGRRLVAVGSTATLLGGPAVAVGVVRGLGSTVATEAATALYGMILTDTPIDPRTAGGALVDDQGAVVGITGVAPAAADGSRAAFATPIEIASAVASDLITTGHVRHAWLGIDGGDLDTDRARALSVDGGAVVRFVQRSSPAAASLAAGDIITAIDGRAVSSMGAVIMVLHSHHPGERISLRTHRGNSDRSVNVVLAERPRSSA